jgi:DNA-binding IscR family transcriptional regulator
MAGLQVLGELTIAQRSGHTVTLSSLRHRVQLGLEDLEELLDRLRAANIVRRAENAGWLLSRAPQDIHAADVYRLFIFDAEHATPLKQADRLSELIADLARNEHQALQITLAELFPDAADGPGKKSAE